MIQRYEFYTDGFDNFTMKPLSDGEYVTFTDHESDKNAELEWCDKRFKYYDKEIARLHTMNNKMADIIKLVQEELKSTLTLSQHDSLLTEPERKLLKEGREYYYQQVNSILAEYEATKGVQP